MQNLVKISTFVLLLLLIFPSICLADSTLGVTPLKLDYELQPGESVTKTIQAFNPGQDSLKVTTIISDYKVNEQGVPVFMPPGQNPMSAGNWIIVTPTQFDLAPGENKDITLQIKAPENPGPGGHYGAVLFEFGGGKSPKSGVGVSGRIAVVNLVTIPGEIKKSGSLQRLSIPLISAAYPVPIQLTLQNNGNVHLPIDGTVEIKNWLGGNASSIPIPEGFIYPGALKTVNLAMSNGPMFGFYQATVSFAEPAISTPASRTFFVIPWALILGILLAAFGLYKLGVTTGRKRKEP